MAESLLRPVNFRFSDDAFTIDSGMHKSLVQAPRIKPFIRPSSPQEQHSNLGQANKWADAEGIHHAGPLGIGQEAQLESKMWQVPQGLRAHAARHAPEDGEATEARWVSSTAVWGFPGVLACVCSCCCQADLAALGSLVPAAWTLLGSAATDLGSDLWEVSSSAVPVPAAVGTLNCCALLSRRT